MNGVWDQVFNQSNLRKTPVKGRLFRHYLIHFVLQKSGVVLFSGFDGLVAQRPGHNLV